LERPDSNIKKILIISDGHLGRQHRSEAVAAALGRKARSLVNTVQIEKRFSPPRWLESLLIRASCFRSVLWVYLGWVYGKKCQNFPLADLAISAGGSTIGANLALMKAAGGLSVFCGDRKRIPAGLELIVSMNPDAIGRHKHVFTIVSSPMDPDWLEDANTPIQTVGIMLGGPSGQVLYSDADWSALVSLADRLKGAGLKLVIGSSPRTPEIFYQHANHLLNEPGFIDFRKHGPGSSASVYSTDAIIVTIDSISMITQAVTSRRPVVVVEPNLVNKLDDKALLDLLVAEKRIYRQNIHDANSENLLKIFASLTPVSENLLDRLSGDVSRIFFRE